MFKAVAFATVAAGLLAATGPLVALAAGLTGRSDVPAWAYSGVFSALLFAATTLALRLDGDDLHALGLAPTRTRLREAALGFAVGVALFGGLAMQGGAAWNGAAAAMLGLVPAFLMLLPEELLFRGYAFRRAAQALGPWPAIVISAALFGAYHVAGSGMWGMGAFFRFAMPALGGVVFGWAAVRTSGLALPIGLHLGGNWMQAAFTQTGATLLPSPDLGPHLPYIISMIVVMRVLHGSLSALPPARRAA